MSSGTSELVEWTKTLNKCYKVDGSKVLIEDKGTATDVLALISQFPSSKINAEVLRECKTGLALGKLAKSDDADIKATSTQIMLAWKKLIVAADDHHKNKTTATPVKKSTAESGTAAAATKPTTPKAISTTAPVTPIVAPTTPSSSNAAASPVELDEEATSLLGKLEDFRNKTQKLLYTNLKVPDVEAAATYLTRWEEKQITPAEVKLMSKAQLACDIEAEMYKVTVTNSSNREKYNAKYREIAGHLKDVNNPEIHIKLFTRRLSCEQLVTLPPSELASDALKEKRRKEAEWEFEAARSDNKTKESATDQFPCAKCKGRKCTYYQLQTRSADEPMTVFITCLNCGNKWKDGDH